MAWNTIRKKLLKTPQIIYLSLVNKAVFQKCSFVEGCLQVKWVYQQKSILMGKPIF